MWKPILIKNKKTLFKENKARSFFIFLGSTNSKKLLEEGFRIKENETFSSGAHTVYKVADKSLFI